jgi:hypothetical protein
MKISKGVGNESKINSEVYNLANNRTPLRRLALCDSRDIYIVCMYIQRLVEEEFCAYMILTMYDTYLYHQKNTNVLKIEDALEDVILNK